ncbi:hypothetical protein COL26b_008306 [Colletotrichum chrysophilum]|uniref:uncharacterized protein n=1 Tax=Colletotrichum chrysophilum TaxID=1836956 RepID=UPI002300A883|nr:uncharacterized protein COL26b_008306 [Colletotrichum chrysophilum]KAJ0373448.1 hypothetical protein COL26b_008306 [Colletotrichum chrysophilum]
MQIIAGEDEDDSYWFTDQPSPPYGPGYAEVPQTIKSANGQIGGKTFLVDNDFANRIMSSIRDKSLQLPLVHPACILCTKCKRLSETIWDPAFSITYTVKHLNSNSVSKACNLCGLLWRVYEKHGMTKLSEVMFERNQSIIKMNGEGAPVLSIYRSPGT